MPIFFLDTSALVKRYLDEKGSDVIDGLFENLLDNDALVISQLAVVELKAVFRRLLKGKVLREQQVKILLSEFVDDRAAMSASVSVDPALMEESAALLDRHALNAGDAIQLASALKLRSTFPGSELVVVVTSDADLSEACAGEGFRVLNPELNRV